MTRSKSKGHNWRKSTSESDAPIAQEFGRSIPEGDYEAICYKVEVGLSGWTKDSKCYLRFRLIGGDYDGTELFMACTYHKGVVKPRSKYYSQWMLATGRRPAKGEKLSCRVFEKKMYTVHARYTKRKFSDGKPMPPNMQYSVVDTIRETLTGVPSDEK